MKIVIVASQTALASGVTGLADMFALAEQAARVTGASPPDKLRHWQVVVASVDGQPVVTPRGTINVDAAIADIEHADAVLFPGATSGPEIGMPATDRLRAFAPWLRRQYAQGALVGGSCAGVFALGEAGLLDERRATVTWWLFDELKKRFPRTEALWGSSIVSDGQLITTGGAFSWAEMALAVIRRLSGPEAARATADHAVVDSTPLPQTAYIPQGFAFSGGVGASPFLRNAENAVREAGARGFGTGDLARAMNVSERTLHRRLAGSGGTGESPRAFIARVRLDLARLRLETTTRAVKAIGRDAGYADDASFRRAFARHTGMSPGSYRLWARQRRDGLAVDASGNQPSARGYGRDGAGDDAEPAAPEELAPLAASGRSKG